MLNTGEISNKLSEHTDWSSR